MKNVARVLIGGALVACGCGFFLYPNFREWNTQREVEQIIETFDKTYDEGLDETDRAVQKNDSKDTEKSSNSEDKHAEATTATATPAEGHDKDINNDTKKQNGQTNGDKNKSKQTARPYQSLYDKMTSYNEDLVNNGQHITDAWSYEQQPFDLTGLGIDSENPAIGYIEVPDMKIRLPLLLGASTGNLEKGAAVMSHTSMPTGGIDTNCVIAGHRGWEGSAYFQYIENMKKGSRVYITNPWETLVYECTNIKVIDPNDVDSIMIQKGKDMVTLLSCHPYVLGGGPYRYVVYCERVDTQERKTTDGVMNPKSSSPSPTDEAKKDTEEETESTVNTDNELTDGTSSQTSQTNASPAIVQNQDGIDLLALEQTLRYMLPVIVVLVSAIIILLRKPVKTKKNKKKSRKHKRYNNKKNKKPKNGNKRRKQT